MVSVTLRFLATLFGTLAAFFLVSHLMHAGGLISEYALSRVDEFYTLLLKPLTTLEDQTQKTLTILAVAMLAQIGLIYMLFRRWDRPPAAKPIMVERVEREIPERLRGDYQSELRDGGDVLFEDAIPSGPSARAMEAARRLAGH